MFHPGKSASADDICLEFYWNGKLVAAYSTLDFAVGGADFVMYLVARKEYTVLAEDFDYVFVGGEDAYMFGIRSIRNANVFFDIQTGEKNELWGEIP